jgi:hypothetical protein
MALGHTDAMQASLVRFFIVVPLLLAGALLSLYGLFAILDNGEGPHGSQTYVTVAGHSLDADIVGAVVLVAGLAMLVSAVALFRRART